MACHQDRLARLRKRHDPLTSDDQRDQNPDRDDERHSQPANGKRGSLERRDRQCTTPANPPNGCVQVFHLISPLRIASQQACVVFFARNL